MAICSAFLWESLEAVSLISTKTYFGAPRVEGESILDSLVGDPLQAIFAVLVAAWTFRAFDLHPLFRTPPVSRGKDCRQPDVVAAALDILHHPLGRTSWILVRVLVILVLWTACKVFDWLPILGVIGFVLGVIASVIVIGLAALLFINDRYVFPTRGDWFRFFALWAAIIVLLAIPTVLPVFAYLSVNGAAALWTLAMMQISVLKTAGKDES